MVRRAHYKELERILLKQPNAKVLYKQPKLTVDVGLVVEINGVIISIESKGDPNTKLDIRLNDLFKKYSCSLIFCACRSEGETKNAVQNFCIDNSFDLIWTSTYTCETNNGLIAKMNEQKASHLLDLARFIGYKI